MASVLVPVDDALRYVLYGVGVLLQIDLHGREIERLFAAKNQGDSSARKYEFHRSPLAVVRGRVDEHEPESVWLSVEAKGFDQKTLERLAGAALHVSFGLASDQREKS